MNMMNMTSLGRRCLVGSSLLKGGPAPASFRFCLSMHSTTELVKILSRVVIKENHNSIYQNYANLFNDLRVMARRHHSFPFGGALYSDGSPRSGPHGRVTIETLGQRQSLFHMSTAKLEAGLKSCLALSVGRISC